MLPEQIEKRVGEWVGDRDADEIMKVLEEYEHEFDAELRMSMNRVCYYVMLREQGVPVWLAAGNAIGQMARMKNSAGAFHEHARHQMENMPKWRKEKYLQMAKKAGINTHGRYFMTGLGGPENPDAWVHGPDDVLEVCKRRNLSCEGTVNYEGHEVPPKQVALADSLVEEMVKHECEQDPGLKEKCAKDQRELSRLRSLVTEKYGMPKSRMKSA